MIDGSKSMEACTDEYELCMIEDSRPMEASIVAFAQWFELQPRQQEEVVNSNCCYDGFLPATALKYRVHTHSLGRQVNMTYSQFDKDYNLQYNYEVGDPQMPQTVTNSRTCGVFSKMEDVKTAVFFKKKGYLLINSKIPYFYGCNGADYSRQNQEMQIDTGDTVLRHFSIFPMNLNSLKESGQADGANDLGEDNPKVPKFRGRKKEIPKNGDDDQDQNLTKQKTNDTDQEYYPQQQQTQQSYGQQQQSNEFHARSKLDRKKQEWLEQLAGKNKNKNPVAERHIKMIQASERNELPFQQFNLKKLNYPHQIQQPNYKGRLGIQDVSQKVDDNSLSYDKQNSDSIKCDSCENTQQLGRDQNKDMKIENEQHNNNQLQQKSSKRSIKQDNKASNRYSEFLVEYLVGKTPSQISSVAYNTVDKESKIWLLLRPNTWESETFENYNIVNKERVQDPCIVAIDAYNKKSKILDPPVGAELFYMPHGLYIDRADRMWVTDVGSHMVYLLDKNGNLLRTWGSLLAQGNVANATDVQFCGPTSVQVANNGDFFVSDGYCNQRVLHFFGNGTLWNVYQIPNARVVHSLYLHECAGLLYVADRDNSNIYVIDVNQQKLLGDRKLNLQSQGRIFALAGGTGGDVYALCQSYTIKNQIHTTYIVEIDMNGRVKQQWELPTYVESPHDFEVSVSSVDKEREMGRYDRNETMDLKYMLTFTVAETRYQNQVSYVHRFVAYKGYMAPLQDDFDEVLTPESTLWNFDQLDNQNPMQPTEANLLIEREHSLLKVRNITSIILGTVIALLGFLMACLLIRQFYFLGQKSKSLSTAKLKEQKEQYQNIKDGKKDNGTNKNERNKQQQQQQDDLSLERESLVEKEQFLKQQDSSG